ncbi:MAG: tryptophan-rich sensory protein, partial [Thermomicrobiaceae bacterium]|nr:tryptophan-rich sensory protein [Thermomicrobiaceae bacterium]
AFGPVWTTLYAMMGIAVYLATRGTQAGQERGSSVARARGVFGLQLGLNVLWSILFFGLRSPLAALADLVALWVAILLTIVAFARRSRVAAALMGPYLAWTTFAGVLNAAIWWLNRDQPGS